MFVLGLLSGSMAGRNIVFGITVTDKLLKSQKVKQIKKTFTLWYIGLVGTVTIASMFLDIVSNSNSLIFGVYMVLWIVLVFGLFIVHHQKIKKYKVMTQKNDSPKKRIISAEIGNGRIENKNISIMFLPSYVLIIGTFIYTTLKYNDLPSQIPIHFNYEGVVTNYADKSLLSAHGTTITSLLLTLLVYIITFYTIRYSKRQLDPRQPKTSAYRIKKANHYFAIVMSLTAFCLNVMFVVIQLVILGQLSMNQMLSNVITFLPVSIILISVLFFFLRIGIQGERLKVDIGESVREDVEGIDNDTGWYLGMFYANPKDHSIFVPKRLGGGYTINFANPLGWVIILLIIGFVVVINIIS